MNEPPYISPLSDLHLFKVFKQASWRHGSTRCLPLTSRGVFRRLAPVSGSETVCARVSAWGARGRCGRSRWPWRCSGAFITSILLRAPRGSSELLSPRDRWEREDRLRVHSCACNPPASPSLSAAVPRRRGGRTGADPSRGPAEAAAAAGWARQRVRWRHRETPTDVYFCAFIQNHLHAAANVMTAGKTDRKLPFEWWTALWASPWFPLCLTATRARVRLRRGVRPQTCCEWGQISSHSQLCLRLSACGSWDGLHRCSHLFTHQEAPPAAVTHFC